MSEQAAEPLSWLPGGVVFNKAATIFARLLEVSTFALTLAWVLHSLGGLGFKPKVMSQGSETSNDTSAIFNWHPLLMSLAYPVCMAEALLAYREPLSRDLARSQRKVLHAALHTAAIVFAVFAIIATFKSHTLKKPVPIPNLYSPHSYLGIFTFALTLAQYLVGLGAFLVPKVPARQKAYYAPHHRFLGQATFVFGLATMAVGIQEKTTFVQQGKSLSGAGLFTDTLKIPASLLLLLSFTGFLVLYHHINPVQSPKELQSTRGAGSAGLLGEGDVEQEL